MKIIMSFWSKPYRLSLHNKWINPDSFFLSWLMSTNLASGVYSEPVLYTDDFGKEILTKKGVKFSKIITNLNAYEDCHPAFCSTIARAAAIKDQDEPFIYIDYDAYLWNKIPDQFIDETFFLKEIITNNKKNNSFYKPLSVSNVLSELPDFWKPYAAKEKIRSYSCSILGGKKIDILKEWADVTLRVVNANMRVSSSDLSGQKLFSREHGSILGYSLDDFMMASICQERGITPKFLVNSYNMTATSLTHVFKEKSSNGSLYGRLLDRGLRDFPEHFRDVETVKKESKLGVNVFIMPRPENGVYNACINALAPRKISPDHLFVINNNIPKPDIDLINNTNNIVVIQDKLNEEIDFFNLALNKADSDVIILLYGDVRLPKLYIENSIAAVREFPDSVFCTGANDYTDDSPSKKYYSYGGKIVNNKVYAVEYHNVQNIKDTEEVEALYGRVFIFPREILKKCVDSGYKTILDISKNSNNLAYKIRCIKNIVVSNAKKNSIHLEPSAV